MPANTRNDARRGTTKLSRDQGRTAITAEIGFRFRYIYSALPSDQIPNKWVAAPHTDTYNPNIHF
ncbi:MAG: hypothetical protein ACSHX8_10240 [Opitutaceae bacterium]